MRAALLLVLTLAACDDDCPHVMVHRSNATFGETIDVTLPDGSLVLDNPRAVGRFSLSELNARSCGGDGGCEPIRGSIDVSRYDPDDIEARIQWETHDVLDLYSRPVEEEACGGGYGPIVPIMQ